MWLFEFSLHKAKWDIFHTMKLEAVEIMNALIVDTISIWIIFDQPPFHPISSYFVSFLQWWLVSASAVSLSGLPAPQPSSTAGAKTADED